MSSSGRSCFSPWARAKEYSPVSLSILLRSEEHTSELQSRLHLVCRLLLEKKKKISVIAARREGRSSGNGPFVDAAMNYCLDTIPPHSTAFDTRSSRASLRYSDSFDGPTP